MLVARLAFRALTPVRVTTRIARTTSAALAARCCFLHVRAPLRMNVTKSNMGQAVEEVSGSCGEARILKQQLVGALLSPVDCPALFVSAATLAPDCFLRGHRRRNDGNSLDWIGKDGESQRYLAHIAGAPERMTCACSLSCAACRCRWMTRRISATPRCASSRSTTS